MDYLEAIRTQALLGVMRPDEEAWLRSIFRYYSEKWATPLHLVQKLPLEDVLLNYFESYYESLEDVQIQELLHTLTDSPEERLEKENQIKEAESQDDAFLQAAEEDAKKELLKIKTPAPKPVPTQDTKLPEPLTTNPMDLPEISMDFSGNLDKDTLDLAKSLLQSDSLRAPPPGKKKAP